MLKVYSGSCHCGAIRFEVELDLSQTSYRCNCSICRRTRLWPAVATEHRLRLVAGAHLLTEYVFGQRKMRHFFCQVCGVQPFDATVDASTGRVYGINIGCLEGVTDAELSRIPITYVDGLHDRPDRSPQYFSHL
jgi:hypothetical protein